MLGFALAKAYKFGGLATLGKSLKSHKNHDVREKPARTRPRPDDLAQQSWLDQTTIIVNWMLGFALAKAYKFGGLATLGKSLKSHKNHDVREKLARVF